MYVSAEMMKSYSAGFGELVSSLLLAWSREYSPLAPPPLTPPRPPPLPLARDELAICTWVMMTGDYPDGMAILSTHRDRIADCSL